MEGFISQAASLLFRNIIRCGFFYRRWLFIGFWLLGLFFFLSSSDALVFTWSFCYLFLEDIVKWQDWRGRLSRVNSKIIYTGSNPCIQHFLIWHNLKWLVTSPPEIRISLLGYICIVSRKGKFTFDHLGKIVLRANRNVLSDRKNADEDQKITLQEASERLLISIARLETSHNFKFLSFLSPDWLSWRLPVPSEFPC